MNIDKTQALRRSAQFDRSRAYRYLLVREWNPAGSLVTFVMLNPSTADAAYDDPTIRRCIGYAHGWGFGRLEVVNLFAFRTANTRVLRGAPDPVGPENDCVLKRSCVRADIVILAWGAHGAWMDRSARVLTLLAECNSVYCFGRTASGQPLHPLYLPRNRSLLPVR